MLSPVFGTRGSEVQILSPRPYKPININLLQETLQRTRFARSPKKSPIRKGDRPSIQNSTKNRSYPVVPSSNFSKTKSFSSGHIRKLGPAPISQRYDVYSRSCEA